MKTSFLKKKGIAVKKIAGEIYLLNKNDRLPTMQILQEKHHISRGTVQNALAYLKKEGAIQTKSQGHLGTFIKAIDHKKLRKYADADRLVGTMPLPYSKLYEGLATGLYMIFNQQEIKLNLAFIRGAKSRMESVEKKTYDFAVVSRFAAEKEIEKGANISIVLAFGENTYLSKHVLILSDESQTEITDGMRVGIDEDSLDHYHLTKDLTKEKEVQLIDYPANQLIHGIRENNLDAGIWNYDEIIEKGYSDLKVVDIETTDYHSKIREAVIVCEKDNLVIQSIIKNNISIKAMKEYQTKVKSGQIVPRF